MKKSIYANRFLSSSARCASMDDEIREQTYACAQHISAH